MSELKQAVQEILNEKPILMDSFDSTKLYDFHHILRENFGITDIKHQKISNIVKLAKASKVKSTEALRDKLIEQLDETEFSYGRMSKDLASRLKIDKVTNYENLEGVTSRESKEAAKEYLIGYSKLQGGGSDITLENFERNWGGRTTEMRDKLNSILRFEKGTNPNVNMLTLGPRWPAEITYIREKFNINAIGLDLFSIDEEKVKVGDMHEMPFEDDSFDILYEKNTYNKSYDFRKCLDESVRVLRDGGLLIYDECMDYVGGVTENGRTNLKSHKWTEAYLGDNIGEVLYSKEQPADPKDAHWLRKVGLFIARIKK